MEYIKPLNDDAYPERLGAYVNANPSLGTPGSTVPGEALQHTMTEIINAITAAGLTPDDADLTQLTQAILQHIKLSIVGIVSQLEGIPTGAVIEQGSNTNGNYIKFADGTMICRNPAGLYEARTASGILTTRITFAAAFISTAISIVSMPGTSRPDYVSGPGVVNLTNTLCDFIIHRTDTPSSAIHYLAIGRWF